MRLVDPPMEELARGRSLYEIRRMRLYYWWFESRFMDGAWKMIAEGFDRTLRLLARHTPFQPFTMELMSGGRIEVDHPEALIFRGGLAVCISPDRVPTLFDHHSISRLIGEGEKADQAS